MSHPHPVTSGDPVDRFRSSAPSGGPAENEALDRLYVKIERFASVLQEKYGLSRSEARRKIVALKRAFHED